MSMHRVATSFVNVTRTLKKSNIENGGEMLPKRAKRIDNCDEFGHNLFVIHIQTDTPAYAKSQTMKLHQEPLRRSFCSTPL
jgi:hypothetical protein